MKKKKKTYLVKFISSALGLFSWSLGSIELVVIKLFNEFVMSMVYNFYFKLHDELLQNLKVMLLCVRAFTTVELKNYNAILVPSIYQKSLAAVEAKP